MSVDQGILFSKWKTGITLPFLKKSGLELVMANYQPVTNLSFLSKALEKCVLQQFSPHYDTYNLMPEHQSAYRAHHNYETALFKIISEILWSVENRWVTALTAIDLSTAFDIVDNEIFFDLLNKQFGVKSMPGTGSAYISDQDSARLSLIRITLRKWACLSVYPRDNSRTSPVFGLYQQT